MILEYEFFPISLSIKILSLKGWSKLLWKALLYRQKWNEVGGGHSVAFSQVQVEYQYVALLLQITWSEIGISIQ